MKLIKFSAQILLFSVLLISCGKKNNLGKMIPKDASIIIHFNSKSILSKLSWEEIKSSYWYSKVMSDSSIPATSKTFMNDPEKTGIDLKSDMVFFALKPGMGGQAIIEGSLSNSKAFGDFLKNMHPDAVVSKDGDLNIFKTDKAVIGWNDGKFAFVANTNKHDFKDGQMLTDSTVQAVPLPLPSSDSLAEICKNLFKLNDDNSLFKNEKFGNLADEDGDVHFWLNVSELSKGSMPAMPGMAGMVKLDKFLDDNISTATISFQDGKIAANHKQYFGKELSDILKTGDGNINDDMIKRIPSQNLAGIFSLHFTPANLLEIVKLTGLDGFINIFLSSEGLSLDDIVKATKGDILFAVNDITIKKDTLKLKGLMDTVKDYYNRTDAAFLFAVSVGDKNAFNKMMNVGKKMGKDMAPKNTFSKTDDKYYATGNSQAVVDKFFSNQQTDHVFLSKVNDHPMAMYVDLQMVLKAMQPEFTKDSISKIYYDRNITMWNNMYASGGEFKNGGIVHTGELNFIDKATNSLKQLSKYADDIIKINVENKKNTKQHWVEDSTMSAPYDSLSGPKKHSNTK